MSQSAKDYLDLEMKRKLGEADAIIAKVEEDGRSLAEEERQKVEDLRDEVSKLRARKQEIEDNEQLRESIDRLRGTAKSAETVEDPQTGSLSDAFIRSDAYRALMASGMSGNWTTGPVELPSIHGATVTTTASPIVEPDFKPGIDAIPLRRLTVADLLASGTTDSNSVVYPQQTSETNAAGAIAEGDPKPESTIVLAQVTEAVRKIATFLPVSDEMLEDVSQIRSFLDNRLRLFVQHQEEAQLINGNGTAPNLRGLLARSGIQTATRAALGTAAGEGAGESTVVSALYQAITNIRVNANNEPDGIVMHPTNWAAVRLSKDANKQFYGGGPFMGPYGQGGIAADNVWGLPVVVTSAMPLNTALVGAFGSQAQVFRKGGLTVEASNSHNDFFQKNLTAIRAEERLALAVYRTNAFHAITALQTA